VEQLIHIDDNHLNEEDLWSIQLYVIITFKVEKNALQWDNTVMLHFILLMFLD